MAAPDDEWFDALWLDHSAKVWGYAARRVGAEYADDVVAETFLVAWRRRADAPPSNYRNWLYGIAFNVARNDLRGADRQVELVDRIRQQPTPEFADPLVRIDLRDAIGQLGDDDAEVLRLHYWDGLSASEAAYVVGCTVFGYKSRLFRARRRIRTLLAEGAP